MLFLAQQTTPHAGGIQALWSAFYETWGYTAENTVVALLLLAAAWLIWAALRNAFWREAADRLMRNRRAVISFFVLAAYLLVGVLDSVRWRDYETNDAGDRLPLAAGGFAMQDRPRSLLDRLDGVTLNLHGKEEKTYSMPFADQEFVKVTQTAPDGGALRAYPPLQYPHRHPLGTDQVGKDVLYKAIKAIRTGLVIGGITTLIAIPFALFFGVQAGYFGRWIDDLITYIYSTLASIPGILLIIAFILAFGKGLTQLCIIMGVTAWTGLCRLIRGEVLKLREMDYVYAARAIGAGPFWIQVKHVIPNVMHLVVIRTVLMFSGLVLAEAVLSYLNVGVGPNTMSWGSMINAGRFELAREPIIWWNLIAAFVFMFGLVLPANIFGDAVRDALDPRLKATD